MRVLKIYNRIYISSVFIANHCNTNICMGVHMVILCREYNVTTRYKDILYMQKSNLNGTCSALFLERGDKKLYNVRCVGGRIARLM